MELVYKMGVFWVGNSTYFLYAMYARCTLNIQCSVLLPLLWRGGGVRIFVKT